MKRNICMFTLLVLLAFSQSLYAHPPSNIEIEYDVEERTLDVKMLHVTTNIRKHYIRKFTVYKNGEQIKSYFFPAQTSPKEFNEKISLEAEGGDEIKIKAICSVGGLGESSIKVP